MYKWNKQEITEVDNALKTNYKESNEKWIVPAYRNQMTISMQQILYNRLRNTQLVKNGFYKIHTKYTEKISEKKGMSS